MSIIVKTAGVEAYLEGGEGRLKFLLTGPAGSGKTRFTGFAPKPIIAACEEGILSVADLGTPYAAVQSEEDMNAFLKLLEDEGKKPKAQRRWETAVIDTVDAYERHLMTNYLIRTKAKEFEGWEAWGYLSGAMNNLLARLMRLDMHIIMLIHTKAVTRDGQIPKDQLVLRLKGDVGQQLPNDFDFVGMIETSYVAGADGREIKREIRWESTPAAPWLKFRGKGVKTTPLTFDPSDFAAIRQAIADGAKNATESQEIETVEAPADVTPPVAPGPGVAAPVAKKATPRPTATAGPPQPVQPPAATPAVPPVPAAPRPVAPVPAAAKPDLSPPVKTPEEAVAHVKEVMPGSTVVSDSAGKIAPEEPVPAPPAPEPVAETPTAPEPETPTATPVEESQPEADPAPEQDDTSEQTAPEESTDGYPAIPATGSVQVQCGTPRFTDSAPKGTVPGCGKELTVTLEDSRIIGVEPAGEMAQFVEMAALRERAVLCNACFKDARTAATAN